LGNSIINEISQDNASNYHGALPASITNPFTYKFSSNDSYVSGYFLLQSYIAGSPDTVFTEANVDLSTLRVFALDGSYVSATPLPPTWTMMLIGLAGFGFVAYRRKSTSVLRLA
jgi:uncharacterized protein (DUF2062 family)